MRGVAVSLWPAATTVRICPDVEASLSPSVAAAAIRVCPDVAASLCFLSQHFIVGFAILLRASGLVKLPVFEKTSGLPGLYHAKLGHGAFAGIHPKVMRLLEQVLMLAWSWQPM